MSRDNGNDNDYGYPYPLSRINTYVLSPDQKFYFPNQEKNLLTSRPQTYFSSPVTNDDSTSSCCSISELNSSDHPCLGVEDHVSDDIASDHDIRSPDSPTTPTNQFGVNNVVNISSYPWSLSTLYEISSPPVPHKIYPYDPHTPLLYDFNNKKIDLQQQQQQQKNQQLQQQEQQKQIQLESSQEIISPIQTSPSLSISSCVDYLEENDDKEEEEEEKISYDNNNNACDNNTCEESPKKVYQKKSKEEIFLKFRLPINGIATRTRSKKSTTNQEPPSTKKKHHLSEEEKVLQKYSYKIANIPPYSRKVTLPSQNTPILPQKNSNYPIPKTRQQILTNWTNRDQKRFLSSYLSEGKNFGQLAKTLNKSTKEVVEFYYYFKMSKEFRTAKTMKKDLIGYSAKLEQINESIIKLKHLSEKTISSPATRVPPTRVTFAPSTINKKRRGRPKKGSHVRGGGMHYYY